MSALRALVVDDEQPARERLCRLLKPFDNVEVIGQAEDGEMAIEKIEELQPDVVFLDIQMPGCSGIEVAASLRSPRPRIIFCTAYDEYAVEAFEVHAVDYLLKPIHRARLEKALGRVASDDDAPDSIELATRASSSYPTRFLARRSSRYCVVSGEDVLYFASDGGQTRLQAGDRHYWMQPTLLELGCRLDPQHYFQVSRNAIVNMDAVREVLPLSGGQAEVKLRDGTTLEVSRRRYRDLITRLER